MSDLLAQSQPVNSCLDRGVWICFCCYGTDGNHIPLQGVQLRPETISTVDTNKCLVIHRIINKSYHLGFYPITMAVTLICMTVAEMLISLQQNSTFVLWQGTLKLFFLL